MKNRSWSLTILAVGLVCGVSGSGCSERPYAPNGISQMGGGPKVVLVPGVLGYYWKVCEVAEELERSANLNVQIWDWTALWPSESTFLLGRALDNLSDIKKNRRRAEEFAQKLVAWRAQNPQAPLYLVGISGGAGIVLWACDSLPTDFRIQKIVLVSAAVSPGFDLKPASLRSVDGIYSFYCKNDELLGGRSPPREDHPEDLVTMDRKEGAGAGRVGFDRPSDGRVSDSLWELVWHNDMSAVGHWGNHSDCMKAAFVRTYLVPLLSPGKPAKDWQQLYARS